MSEGAKPRLLFDHASGLFLPVSAGASLPANHPGLVVFGRDDADAALDLRMQADRALVVTTHSAPSNPSQIVTNFVQQATGTDSADLRVDGSSTPIDFTFDADPTDDIFLQSASFVIVAPNIAFNGGRFANLSTLANGVQVLFDLGGEIPLCNLKINEDFIHFASLGGYGFDVGSSDVIHSQFKCGSLKLTAGTTHKVIIRISDKLDSGINYFKCLIKAFKGV